MDYGGNVVHGKCINYRSEKRNPFIKSFPKKEIGKN